MNPTSKKFISLFLTFSLMMLSVNLYAKERRGAKLIVTKKDGQQIKGELITVKPNSLLLLDTEGKDVSIDIADIKVITVVKKSKAWLGGGIGSAAGIIFVALIDASLGEDESVQFLGYVLFGAIGLVAGSLLGGLIALFSGRGKTFQLEGMSDLEINEVLEKLRKKARIRDYK